MKRKTTKLFQCSAILALTTAATIGNAEAFTFGSVPVSPAVGNPAVYTTIPTVGITSADIGNSFNFNWSLTGSTSSPLTATGIFTVQGFTNTDLILGVSLTNTTSSSLQAAILGLGLGVDPNATASYVTAGSIFDGISAGSGPQQTFPGGFKNIDVCAFAANTCSGGNINDGLLNNLSDSFVLDLAGTYSGTATLLAFAVKFQTAEGSFEFPGVCADTDCGGGGGGGGGGAPEPASMALLGIGTLASVLSGRRRKSAKAA